MRPDLQRRQLLAQALALLGASFLPACGDGGGDAADSAAASEAEQIGAAPAVPAAAGFGPASGHSALLVGQTADELIAYLAQVGPAQGLMIYTDLVSQSGLQGASQGGGCEDAGRHDLPASLAALPGGVIQLGLWLGGNQLIQAGNGQLDARIAALGQTLQATGCPVLLRIGYEFDGTWNAHAPIPYQRAFRRMVSILRGNQVGGVRYPLCDRIAFVWHGAASAAGQFENRPESDWYPGDAYVDWVGISWFGEGTPAAEAAASAARERLARFARAHAKPLLIAESAPRRYYPGSDPASWQTWYQPVLDWIAANDVRYWSYINQDWQAQPMWSAQCGQFIWGDSRIQVAEAGIISQWQAAMAGARWHSSSVRG